MARNRTYLSALCYVCQDVISEVAYEKVLATLAQNAAGCLHAKAASVRLLDKSGTNLDIVAAYGLSKAYLKKGPVMVARSPIDREALRGKVVQIKDVTKDKRFQYPREAKKEGLKSVLCTALRCRKRLLGVLRVYTGEQRVFSDEEMAFIKILALQGGAAVRHAQRYRRLNRLNAMGKAMTSQLNTAKVLNMMCQNATEEMFAKGVSVMLINSETGQLEVLAGHGLSEEFLGKGPLKADKSISECFKGNEVIVENALRDKRLQYPAAVKKEKIKSIICIPLKAKDKVVGVMRVYTGYRYESDDEDLAFLNTLAGFGAIAIENARLYEHVRRSYEDLTTNVWKWYGWGTHPPSL